MPLVNGDDSLQGRWWNQFQLAASFQDKIAMWVDNRIMVPVNSNIDYPRGVFPEVLNWWILDFFPPRKEESWC